MKNLRFLKHTLIILAPLLTLNTALAEVKSNWISYKNSEFGFSIQHPKTLQVITDHFYNSYLLTNKWRALNNDGDNSPAHGKLLISIPVFRLNQSDNYCDYYDVELRVGIGHDLKNCQRSDKTVKINGSVFYVYPLDDVAMHQFLSGTSYRTVHNGLCYAVEQLETGSASSGVCENTRNIPEQALKQYRAEIWKMIQTFTFTK